MPTNQAEDLRRLADQLRDPLPRRRIHTMRLLAAILRYFAVDLLAERIIGLTEKE